MCYCARRPVEYRFVTLVEPPATGSPEPTSELKRPFDDTGLAGEASARLRPSHEGAQLTVSANGDVSNGISTSEKGRHAFGHAGRSSCFSAEQHENSTQNVKNVDFDGGNGLTAPSSNGNDDEAEGVSKCPTARCSAPRVREQLCWRS